MGAKPDPRARNYAPRGLRREAAAAWVGFGVTKFDEMIRDGRMPKGKLVGGCRVWDRYELDQFFDDLPDDEAPIDLNQDTIKAWSIVK